MKGRVCAIGTYRDRGAAAVIEDGRLLDLFVDPPADVPRLGAVFCGVADRAIKALGGQFVRLSKSATGYLRGGQFGEGQNVLVQVSGYAEPGKAVPLRAKLQFKGRLAVLTPGAPGINPSRKIADPARRAALIDLITTHAPDVEGVILRSASADESDAEIIREINVLKGDAQKVLEHNDTALSPVTTGLDATDLARLHWPGATDGSFDDFEVETLIDEMRQPHVALDAGSASIEPTQAFVAVDVNTAQSTTPAAGLKANIALARDLPRQLRCRGLGGQVVIDFAPCAKRDRPKVEAALRSALKSDPVETTLVGWTAMGLFELVRKRARPPL